ncbi:glycoside hydrolase family 61 protein [Stereum hirsutum FP-91666 SS1]|uniref:glycoside hydrolase family 61 protein n=1 Tax=Stereum hirsutum (strain FP-91666) TaxID=721885 RepID=UPI000444976A|nr:glycoside hydrolase family 61 protein [Stereum hirsutum FP-91666 SS1]EIM84462.1 glycoside hydrolase family 61 protein [Stereum hirsutum FP-91666 SS1]
MKSAILAFLALAASVSAHYTFPSLVLGTTDTADWEYVRETNNFETQAPVTDVTSPDFRCYDTATNPTAQTATVAAGSTLGIMSDGTIYHPGVVNVYMAKAPAGQTAATFDGSGTVWFKVYEITAVTDGGSSISFPAQNLPGVSFTVPENLPSGDYLVRMEAIALHTASTFGGAQFYLSCGQVTVTGGGSGTPGPLVAIPGVYTGNEPGILLNIYYPVPVNYTQPGPAVWSG